MCKLSLNIVPNVYNSLKSSFPSLAWPWPGRSLPKGNQWEWRDPQQGPLPVLGEVGHSQGEPVGSAWTLNWGPMCWAPSPLATQMHPWHPLTAPRNPPMPLMPPIPFWPWVPTLPASPKYTPDTPYTSWCPLHPLGAPMPLYATYTTSGPWAPTLPASPPMHPWQPLHPLMLLTPLHP